MPVYNNEYRILRELIRRGGRTNNLFQLALDLDIHYSRAHDSVYALQRRGLISISRPNHELIMEVIGEALEE